MKNKVKALAIIFIGLISLNIEGVDAGYSATGYLEANSKDTGIVYLNANDLDNENCVTDPMTGIETCYNEPYHDNNFKIKMNGLSEKLEGYCIDPSYAMSSGGVAMTCERVDSYRVAKSINYILNKGQSHLVTQLALRFVAYDTGIAQNASKHGKYIKAYWQNDSGLSGGNDLGQAKKLYKDAMQAVKGNSGSKKGENQIILTQTRTEVNDDKTEYTVTYRVKTVEKEKMDVQFTCDGCEIVEGANFSGTSDEIKVKINGNTAKNNDCTYKIKANYKAENDQDIYICKSSGYQQIITALTFEQQKSLEISTAAKQEFEYGIPTTTGDFYKKYCKNQNSCGGDEGTKFEIPEYCDNEDGKTLQITGPNNIQSCVLRSQDEAGYTYQDTSAVGKNNKYCSVYCKEDYTMTMPGAQFASSGRYFKLKNTKITGTRTCYITGAATSDAEGIELNQFKEDVKASQRALVDAYNSYAEENAIANNASSYTQYVINNCSNATGACTISSKSVAVSSSITSDATTLENMKKRYENAQNDLNAILKDIGECYNWNNNYCFDPLASFDYNEEYPVNYEAVNKGKKGYDKKGIKVEKRSTTAGTSTDKEYNVNDKLKVEDVKYLGCNESGCSDNENTTKISTNAQIFIKKTVKKSVEFNNTQEFGTKAPHGTITLAQAKSGNYLKDYSYLGAVFPVALKKIEGVYNWTLLFEKIGQKNGNTSSSCTDTSDLGRLNKVANKVLGKDLNSKIGYVCVYIVDIDCPDCEHECECEEKLPTGYTCYKEDKLTCKYEYKKKENCEDCDVYCINCIFNGNDTYNYHTISVSDMDPNNRTASGKMGANWTSEKGENTKQEIESNGEKVYQKPEYSYTITPTQMANIRAYNASQGTYVADDVYYEAQNGYTGARNYSEFLNGKKRGCENNKCFTENARNNSWTLWPENKINENGVGPAWK